MNYQNRGERCKHGFLKEAISCPSCDYTGKRTRYIRSEANAVTRTLGGPRKPRKNVQDPR